MVGLQYFATFLHVAKLPGVAQLSAAQQPALLCDLGPGLDIMGTRHRIIPAQSLQLQNTQLHIRNIAKYCQRFFAPTLENELIFEYFEFWQTISQNVWISVILWAVAGWWGWVMSHPEQRPSPASPHPALSFVVFQNREQQHLSLSLPHSPVSPGTNVVWFTCGWISCCADKIFILMAWPLTYFGAFLSQSVETICCDPWEPGSRGRGRRGRA